MRGCRRGAEKPLKTRGRGPHAVRRSNIRLLPHHAHSGRQIARGEGRTIGLKEDAARTVGAKTFHLRVLGKRSATCLVDIRRPHRNRVLKSRMAKDATTRTLF